MIISLAVLLLLSLAYSLWLTLPILKRKKWNKKHKAFYQSEDSGISHIYTDSFGNNWYQFTTHLLLPAMRSIAAEVAARHAELCMTPEMFAQYVVKLKAACNKNKLVDVAGLIASMEERVSRAAERETLLALADCYFLMEGEDPKHPTKHWSERKRDVWSKDAECEDFFLTAANSLVRNLTGLSDTDLLKYLMKQKSGGR